MTFLSKILPAIHPLDRKECDYINDNKQQIKLHKNVKRQYKHVENSYKIFIQTYEAIKVPYYKMER